MYFLYISWKETINDIDTSAVWVLLQADSASVLQSTRLFNAPIKWVDMTFFFLNLILVFICIWWSKKWTSIILIQIRELNAGQNLHKKMIQFKQSVPLMAKLQNDSLRERHWQHLMQITGHHFSIKTDQFRLSNIFTLNLYKHQVREIDKHSFTFT